MVCGFEEFGGYGVRRLQCVRVRACEGCGVWGLLCVGAFGGYGMLGFGMCGSMRMAVAECGGYNVESLFVGLAACNSQGLWGLPLVVVAVRGGGGWGLQRMWVAACGGC